MKRGVHYMAKIISENKVSPFKTFLSVHCKDAYQEIGVGYTELSARWGMAKTTVRTLGEGSNKPSADMMLKYLINTGNIVDIYTEIDAKPISIKARSASNIDKLKSIMGQTLGERLDSVDNRILARHHFTDSVLGKITKKDYLSVKLETYMKLWNVFNYPLTVTVRGESYYTHVSTRDSVAEFRFKLGRVLKDAAQGRLLDSEISSRMVNNLLTGTTWHYTTDDLIRIAKIAYPKMKLNLTIAE